MVEILVKIHYYILQTMTYVLNNILTLNISHKKINIELKVNFKICHVAFEFKIMC